MFRGRVAVIRVVVVVATLLAGLVVAAGPGSAVAPFAWQQVGADVVGVADGEGAGSAVALSADGTRLAVGAPRANGPVSMPGVVRVFDRVGSSWVQVGADLVGDSNGDDFGAALALSADGSRVVVGARFADAGGALAGRVEVFDFDAGSSSWVQVGGSLDGSVDETFGGAVAVSADGSRVVVGAPGIGTTGLVRVFDFDAGPSDWVQVGADIDGEATGDRFGGSVAVSADGSRFVAGAPFNASAGNAYAGHARVFDLVGSSWVQVGADIDGDASQDQLGSAVAMSGDGSRLAVGSPGGGTAGSGLVRVFDFDAGPSDWVQVGADIDGEDIGDRFGASLMMSADGEHLVAGSIGRLICLESAGRARVFGFDPSSSDWVQLGSGIDGASWGAELGVAVAISANGSYVAVGAPESAGAANDPMRGRALVFEMVSAPGIGEPEPPPTPVGGSGGWSQVGADVVGGQPFAYAGYATALSADGSRLVVGMPGTGDLAGVVRVFDLVGSSWVQVGGDLFGDPGTLVFGLAVALSADGSRLVVGAPGIGGAGSGYVQVFEFDAVTAAWVPLGQPVESDDPDDRVGYVVSVSGDGSVLAVTIQRDDSDSNEVVVFGFDPSSSAWVPLGAGITGTSDSAFAFDVSLASSAPRVAVGSPNVNTGAGEVAVFEFVGSGWVPVGGVLGGATAGEGFGASVMLSADGARLAVGSPNASGNGDESGSVRVFDLVGGAWSQVGTDLRGVEREALGYSVALSSDGSRLAVGAPGSLVEACGVAGVVRVFDLVGGAWSQAGGDIVAAAFGDANGYSVALSASGSRVVAGAPYAGAARSIVGLVRVFDEPIRPAYTG